MMDYKKTLPESNALFDAKKDSVKNKMPFSFICNASDLGDQSFFGPAQSGKSTFVSDYMNELVKLKENEKTTVSVCENKLLILKEHG